MATVCAEPVTLRDAYRVFLCIHWRAWARATTDRSAQSQSTEIPVSGRSHAVAAAPPSGLTTTEAKGHRTGPEQPQISRVFQASPAMPRVWLLTGDCGFAIAITTLQLGPIDSVDVRILSPYLQQSTASTTATVLARAPTSSFLI
jgi:hypothetical protein